MSVRCEAMNMITQCPTCSTRFKVSQAQLDVHHGLVRCGRCQAVFNATEHLQDDQPSPQLDLLVYPEVKPPEPLGELTEVPVEVAVEPASQTQEAPELSQTEPFLPESRNENQQDTEPQNAELQNKIEPVKLITQAQKINFADNPEITYPEPAKNKRTWPWLAGSLLLMITLLAQAAYFFRVELAANQPGLKPALISYCRLLQCTVPLPQKAELMSIESSDLEADPAQSGVIALNALMRNHAPYTQAYPDLELTLTDLQNKPLARRTFHPKEYLKPDEDEKQGLTANRELNVKINLDTTDLKPSGYRLYLFYPE